jgi:hypothetical protein
MSKERFCLQCDDGTLLVHEKRDLSFTYRDRTGTVCLKTQNGLRTWFC